MSSKTKSIRLFQSDFLEAFTHVHPIVPVLLWAPVAALLGYRSLTVHDLSVLQVLGMSLPGLLAWTLSEYLAHRFVFHYTSANKKIAYLVYLFHGVHHDAPHDKSRLLMPPAGALLIMGLFWGLYALLIPPPYIEPFLMFFVLGYLAYDYIHYATHFLPMRGRLGSFLKRNHMLHHYRLHSARYGVSSPLWDLLFGTYGDSPRS